MKSKLILFFLLTLNWLTFGQIKFDMYFTNNTLRIDYIITINSDHIFASLQQLRKEDYWAGTRTYLIDPFNYGNYRYEVYDSITNKLIFSGGYCALSNEYRYTELAKKYYKTFYESINIPYPKNTIKFVFYFRDKFMTMHTILEYYINPNDILISNEKFNYKHKDLIINGQIDKKVDLVIIGDGYTNKQLEEFENDAQQLINFLFNYEPFKSQKNKFNVRIVFSPSIESGTDIPGQNIWRNTILNSHFYTFGVERYLTTEDYKTVKDIASVVPYDQIIILVNTDKYGGGGFYNYLNLTAAKNILAKEIFVHEFGHAFAGLADEYWADFVATNNYYSLEHEPWEPNITTLVDFSSKWHNMIADTIPVPTPSIPKYNNVVGVFEGGGYLAHGIYRPMQNCLMRPLNYHFCKVCQHSIKEIIKYYTD